MQRLAQRLTLVPMNARYCNGQRGHYLIEEDTRRPNINARMREYLLMQPENIQAFLHSRIQALASKQYKHS